MFFLRRCIPVLSLCLSIHESYAQSKSVFTLNGKLVGVDSGTMYLHFYSDAEQKSVEYSSGVNNGKFQFKGKLDAPVVAFIRSTQSRVVGNNNTQIFLEPAIMDLTVYPDRFLELHLTGSDTQADYERLRDEKALMAKPYEKELKLQFDPAYKSSRDSLFSILQPYNDAVQKKDLEFFTTHPQSVVTLYLLQRYITELPADSFARYYSRLGANLQNTFIGQTIYERMAIAKKGQVGSLAASFVTADRNGAAVVSQFFKGRYVLLDFWASWCVPCREGNPQLIRLFQKYRNNKFAIVSIADDRDTVAWKKAIEKDGTGLWTHVLRGADPNLKYNGVADPNDLNDRFGIEVLPTMILLDKDGIVIGRYKDSEEMSLLEKQLEQVLR